MYAVVRTYPGAGAKKLFDVLEKRSADVEALIREVPGLIQKNAADTGVGPPPSRKERSSGTDSSAEARSYPAAKASSSG